MGSGEEWSLLDVFHIAAFSMEENFQFPKRKVEIPADELAGYELAHSHLKSRELSQLTFQSAGKWVLMPEKGMGVRSSEYCWGLVCPFLVSVLCINN